MLENLSFTDAQGQSFTDAVVRVKTATLSSHSSVNQECHLHISLDNLSQPSTVHVNDYDNESKDLNCEYVYWPTKEAYVAGNRPYSLVLLINNDYTANIYLNKDTLNSEAYVNLPLEELCEAYFTDHILPTLTTETP